MKKLIPILLALISAGLIAGCGNNSSHEDDNREPKSGKAVHPEHSDAATGHKSGHDDHIHKSGDADHAEHKDGHDDGTDHAHAEKTSKGGHGHGHEKREVGPNGGHILHEVEPHIEFFVRPDRKIQLTAVDGDLKAIPVTDQRASLVGGSRANPTQMKFLKEGTVLVSDVALPAGDDLPVIVTVKESVDAEAYIEKMQLNLRECPDCKYKEYACICDDHHHEHKHENGHSHSKDGNHGHKKETEKTP